MPRLGIRIKKLKIKRRSQKLKKDTQNQDEWLEGIYEEGVEEVAVIGMPHEFWGELIVACVVPRGGVNVPYLEANLIQRCIRQLADGMRPDRYIWLNKLPRNNMGKVQKPILTQKLL